VNSLLDLQQQYTSGEHFAFHLSIHFSASGRALVLRHWHNAMQVGYLNHQEVLQGLLIFFFW